MKAIPKFNKEYALYKGEELLFIGTIKEIAEKFNVQQSTIKYYFTNAYKRKLYKRKVKNARELVALD
ncbi:hypothetical protein EXM63_02455 [Clostridium botulinum]|uniref:Uncharacterized protein n=1 Tax=Clostridium botulinum TaxID=1491 RepID=A0A6M0SX43_CLOBO|nr:hypothetical protein [Clostridium botulinum]NFI74347.1 hypothetical protein [Clostridium sporogenes]NFP62255.1 hypothetical protein [Clostridium sporogenes]NFU95593.1 hypothetical protein [Clostridium sporogenes]NFV67926.1 hypothetical protein [Clostridium botulinum]